MAAAEEEKRRFLEKWEKDNQLAADARQENKRRLLATLDTQYKDILKHKKSKSKTDPPPVNATTPQTLTSTPRFDPHPLAGKRKEPDSVDPSEAQDNPLKKSSQRR